jgi:Cytochrome P460
VNAVGHSTFISEKVSRFPEGSVIVRERLVDSNSPLPESLVAMVKRGAGFNPAGGDWEYIALNGAGTIIRERGQLGSCNTCHAGQKETDFVFRTYTPEQRPKSAERGRAREPNF